MAIFLAGKAVCYRILAFFCYGKLHFKCESADLCFGCEQDDGKVFITQIRFQTSVLLR